MLHAQRKFHRKHFEAMMSQMEKLLPEPSIDVHQITRNFLEIKENSMLRKEDGDLIERMEKLINEQPALNDKNKEEIKKLSLQLPNNVHPSVRHIKDGHLVVKVVGNKRQFTFKPKTAATILKEKDLLKMDGYTKLCGERPYYFAGHLAKLESALIRMTLDYLKKKGFNLVYVPDILPESIIERCGMNTRSKRTQVFKLDEENHGEGWCLSGTAEMALAALLINNDIPKNKLPLLLTSCSRCYRAEVSMSAVERGIYRVHQFTKVEMFGVSLPEDSSRLLQIFRDHQEELCGLLELHYHVIDMAPHELGRQAHRKFDIEAWMPGHDRFGEITSCSDCTDYQARRLNIRSGSTFVHTVNGTACAIPRVITALSETHQQENGRIVLPKALQPYMQMEILGTKRGSKMHIVPSTPKCLKLDYHV